VIGSTTFARYGYFGLYVRRFQQRSVASGRFDQPYGCGAVAALCNDEIGDWSGMSHG